MVNVDTVYQKVLALSNKEQRGYMTPQEFNLMASKAQMEIFDNYFHNLKTSFYKPKTNLTHADEISMLEDKVHHLKASQSITLAANASILTPADNQIYYISSVSRDEGEVTEVSEEELLYTENNPLTRATINRSVYVRRFTGSNSLEIRPVPLVNTGFVIRYYRRPSSPKWDYVVIKGRALYNADLSVDFHLHRSEEENLVTRILQLAGIVIMKPEITQIGVADQSSTKQEQND
tara:strand:- start:7222 stop:7923 length:702 start_codon:yes stop_codon:yes gene_type:complete